MTTAPAAPDYPADKGIAHPLLSQLNLSLPLLAAWVIQRYQAEEISIGAACELLGTDIVSMRQIAQEVDPQVLRAEDLVRRQGEGWPFSVGQVLAIWNDPERPKYVDPDEPGRVPLEPPAVLTLPPGHRLLIAEGGKVSLLPPLGEATITRSQPRSYAIPPITAVGTLTERTFVICKSYEVRLRLWVDSIGEFDQILSPETEAEAVRMVSEARALIGKPIPEWGRDWEHLLEADQIVRSVEGAFLVTEWATERRLDTPPSQP